MALFHRVVNETVDVEGSALMTRTKRSSQKLNRVQYQTHSSKKDCYKYSFVPRSIIQLNNIDAPDDHKQYSNTSIEYSLHVVGLLLHIAAQIVLTPPAPRNGGPFLPFFGQAGQVDPLVGWRCYY